MSRHSSSGTIVHTEPRAARSWWLQGVFCSHFGLIKTSQLHLMLEATDEHKISCLSYTHQC